MTELLVVAVVSLWVLVLIILFLIVGALRQIGLMQLRLGTDPGALITREGLDRGIAAPDFQLPTLDGGQIALGELGAIPKLLVFLSTTCQSCRELAPHLNEVFDTRHKQMAVVVICDGSLESCDSFAREAVIRPRVAVDTTGLVKAKYEVAMTPFAYFLDFESRVLVRGIANSWTQLESLIAQEGTLEPELHAELGAGHG